MILVAVKSRTFIDAGVDGNDTRYFNHSCAPNCGAVWDAGRIHIEAWRTIEPGEELTCAYPLEHQSHLSPKR